MVATRVTRRIPQTNDFVATSSDEWVAKSMDRLIHPSAWKGNSAKFACTILHRSPSEKREDGFLGHSRRVRKIYILWCWIDMQGDE
jgi:hypothetical protein